MLFLAGEIDLPPEALNKGPASDRGALWYKEHMRIAMRNLKKISDAGIVIAAGTDRAQKDPELEKMDYLVEGVIGATS